MNEANKARNQKISFDEAAQNFLIKNAESTHSGNNSMFTKSVNLQLDNRFNYENERKRSVHSQDQGQRSICYHDGTEVDLTRINSILNSNSTKSAVTTGLLDLALISNNFSQVKQLIVARNNSPLQPADMVLIFAICLSVILQFVSGTIMLMSPKQEFLDESTIKELASRNNLVMVLFLAVTILNIFIDVFMNV
jgi:hypothetical protein